MKETKLSITKRYGKQPGKTEQETLEVRAFATDTATVAYTQGFTKQTNQFEFVRVDVSVTLPCYVEEVESAYETARRFVEARVNTELDKLPSR